LYSYCLSSSLSHRDLHSFPTRRSSDLLRLEDLLAALAQLFLAARHERVGLDHPRQPPRLRRPTERERQALQGPLHRQVQLGVAEDRKSTRLNSSHSQISYAVFCLKKKK